MYKFILISENKYLEKGLSILIEKITGEALLINATNKNILEVVNGNSNEKPKKINVIICDDISYDAIRYKLNHKSNVQVINIPASEKKLHDEIFYPTHRHPAYLSPRESIICKLIKQEKNDNQISIYLNISKKTISTYRRNIMSKLNIKNKKQLYFFCKNI